MPKKKNINYITKKLPCIDMKSLLVIGSIVIGLMSVKNCAIWKKVHPLGA